MSEPNTLSFCTCGHYLAMHALGVGMCGDGICECAEYQPYDGPQIPPKIDPDKEPHLVALRRIADALEMANVIARGE